MGQSIESNISFYDNIAPEYNDRMSDSDRRAREMVRDIFEKYVKQGGTVLDFGGGTGLDIPWLGERYKLHFLEPSRNMRSIAKSQYTSASIDFLPEENTDYRSWAANPLQSQEKIDGVLANFAVLNCIESPEIFFEKLSLVVADGGYLLASLIDPHPLRILRYYGLKQALRMALTGKGVFYNRYKAKLHPTFLHSKKSIKHASSGFFSFQDSIPLPGATFSLFIFKRK